MAHMRNKKRESLRSEQAGELPMTPMIDVVFLLLIYFLMTFSIPETIAHIAVTTPSPDPNPDSKPPTMLKIDIMADNSVAVNGSEVSMEAFEEQIKTQASLDPEQSVLIRVHNDSVHKRTVEVLDICKKYKLDDFSLISRR